MWPCCWQLKHMTVICFISWLNLLLGVLILGHLTKGALVGDSWIGNMIGCDVGLPISMSDVADAFAILLALV